MDTLQPPALGDRYLLCELLGSGGMADVYRARDLRLDRTVAVKVLRPDLAADPVQRARFGREARAAASLNHPAVVAVFDSGEGAGPHLDLPYLVMEYLPGRTLGQVLAEDGPLPPRQALRVVAEILDALDHAHRHGMVHRDVKPANVMVVDEGSVAVKLMDFGIARSLGRGPAAAEAALTAAGMVIGTADYLSPEQARGEAADARSDLYAVGCLLHELLTGALPLTADSPLNTVWRRLHEDPEPPSLLAPSLPPELDALVLRALARDPSARYPDAASMSAAVRALADQEPAALATPRHAPTLVELPAPAPETQATVRLLPPAASEVEDAGTAGDAWHRAAGGTARSAQDATLTSAARRAGSAEALEDASPATGAETARSAQDATLTSAARRAGSAEAMEDASPATGAGTARSTQGTQRAAGAGAAGGAERAASRARRSRRPRRRRVVAATVTTVAVAAMVSVGGWIASSAEPAPAASAHALPRLTGESLSRARHELQVLGLRIGRVSPGDCAGTKAAPRTVCTQSPAVGTVLRRGAAVDVSVSRPSGIAAGG